MTGTIQIPEAFEFLFEPARYKVAYGGRGGAKSHNFARGLLTTGLQQPLRNLCVREIQNSIKDSVHKLLADIIEQNPIFSNAYRITQESISAPAYGTEFIFKGLRNNYNSIRSTEGVDRCWVEEAETVADRSWEVLIPTIRKPGSEIWVSFNPRYPTDATCKRFLFTPRDDAIVRKVSWRDNPFLPDVLLKELEELKKNDPLAYAHVWEGEFDERYFGGVYSKWIVECITKRAKKSLYDPDLPVYTAWDLGYDDATAIWFWQRAGSEVRFIDYYENFNEDIEHYCNILLAKRYPYDTESVPHFVPHDARNKILAAGGKSIVEQAAKLGIKMRVVNATSQQNQIEALRKVLGNSWFDPIACEAGIEALKQYQFEYDTDKKVYKSKPKHDWSSHAADAAEIVGQVFKEMLPSDPPPAPRFLNEVTANEVFWPQNTYKPPERI